MKHAAEAGCAKRARFHSSRALKISLPSAHVQLDIEPHPFGLPIRRPEGRIVHVFERSTVSENAGREAPLLIDFPIVQELVHHAVESIEEEDQTAIVGLPYAVEGGAKNLQGARRVKGISADIPGSARGSAADASTSRMLNPRSAKSPLHSTTKTSGPFFDGTTRTSG